MKNKQSQFIFFSGKGGVGKTSMASTTAVHYAKKGLKTIIVTTDPAANLADVFQQEIGHQITELENIENLYAMEIDSKKATVEYKENTLAPMRDIFNEKMLAVVEEQLNSPCTEEMASFDKFIDFMDEDQYDVVVFDTAPTGHTIRLLELPVDWSKHIEESAEGSGQTCMGPVQNIQDSKEKYDRAIKLLKDEDRTEFIFVMHPESSAIRETDRASSELAKLGINTSSIIVNGILPEEECKNPFFKKRGEMQQKYLKEIKENIELPIKKMQMLDDEIKGLNTLENVAGMLFGEAE